MASFPPQLSPGDFLPTTNVWDVTELYQTDVDTPEFKELLVRLYQNLNNMSISINVRDSGYYQLTETANGQIYFHDPDLGSTSSQTPIMRQVYRKVINFGELPNTATKSVPHGIDITSDYTFTRIYGVANNVINQVYIPLPFAKTGNNVSLEVDTTNVDITTQTDRTLFDVTYIVLEYIKQ